MVVSGSLRVLKLSHVEARTGDVLRAAKASSPQILIRLGSQFPIEVVERFSTVFSPP